MSAILLATRPSESTQRRFAQWFMKFSSWLSNRVFKSYDDIVDHCRDAWRKLIEHPWRIMSIGLRDWVHRF
ncbi:efflux RND transporter permease subunit [Methylocystis sp. B8]|nr:efflux RND transporter permease subunit [Methylocystis sp. B8]